jgi:hypothetical protein
VRLDFRDARQCDLSHPTSEGQALSFGDDVAQRGWKTGSVVPADMLAECVEHLTRPGEEPRQVAEADWLVVVSQTCDIVAQKLEVEPLVEVLHCRRHAGKPRKGLRDLQSTRHLDYRPNRETHQTVVLTAHATADRYVVPRRLLAEFNPDPGRYLDAAAARKVLAWYALRAGRPSWPGRFCDRVRSARDYLEEVLDSLSDDIAEVRVAIAEKDQDLEPNEPYHVVVYFVVDQNVWDSDVEGRKSINAAFTQFVSELRACDGIEVSSRGKRRSRRIFGILRILAIVTDAHARPSVKALSAPPSPAASTGLRALLRR